MTASINLEKLYKGYFGLEKDWCIKLYDLLISHKRVTRKQMEAISSSKYFMRDQLDRLETLNIITIVGKDAKGRPALMKSNIHHEEEH